jgi:hypothetical protein
MKDFSELVGHTITHIGTEDGDLTFSLEGGTICRLYHEQDCCESVVIDSIDGDLAGLVGRPLVAASEVPGADLPPPASEHQYVPESYTWTIYTLATDKHRVVVRFFGESNGYYSEDVRFVAIPAKSEAA